MRGASDPAGRLVRVHWSAGAAMASASLSIGAHALAGGGLPTTAQVMLVIAVSAGVGPALGAVGHIRSRSAEIASVGSALAVAQVLGHLAMHSGGHHAATPLVPGPTMLVLHAAALLTAAVLLVGGQECARRIGSRILASASRRSLPVLGGAPVVAGAEIVLRTRFRLSGIGTRGPPAVPA